MEKELFGYINSERSREKLAPLTWNARLYKVSLAHSNDMVKMGHISHDGSDGSTPQKRIKDGGIFSSKMAENVAKDINVIAVHTSLMESLYHRNNILNPEYTDGAVAIVSSGRYFYVTEDFIRSVDNYSLDEARHLLLVNLNDYREKRGLEKLVPATLLNNIAQSHVDFQEKVSSIGPPLLTGLVARQEKGALRTNVYTTTTISQLPDEVQRTLALKIQSVGIGFKRIKGELCETGCFLITLIFGPESS
jgi:Cysteine-rich secretory protein family